jgi:hypothetical protein
MTTPLVNVLNAMKPQQSGIGDFDRVRTGHPQGDVVLYQALMTACNMHETIASIMQEKGNARSSYHRETANRLRTEANSYIRKG